MAIRIDRVDAGSEAEALGLAGGDELLSVDGNELNDTLDYDFYTDSKSFHLKAKVADGIREWDVRREERGPFGCDFSTYLGDQKHSCSNHCMFCFIDQLPPGMRESLYFKDDDERLSFLFGNYITMTNMQDHEIDRIIKMHISPINISVHTTNPQLRVRMLANKRGGEVLKYLPRLVEGGIAVNCQLVLCRGINDGNELRRTLTDLLCEELGVTPEEILDRDLQLVTRQTPTQIGPDGEYFMSPRIDDLECAATTLLGFLEAGEETDSACAPVWAMFDNEEVGSSSRMGAASSYLRDVLDRIVDAIPHSGQAMHRAMANSFMLSADNAHATHPNFPQKSDPCAPVRLGGGVVLKYNASQKYTTNAVSGAIFRAICEKADVPVQVFTNRADEAGGSTLGNLQSHTLPIPMADIGLAQLAMHSAVETASVADAEAMTKAVAAFYRVHLRALGDGTYTLE